MPSPSGSTAKYGLAYPLESDVPDVPTWGASIADTLDGIIATDSQGVLASRPAAGKAGRYYWATDTKQLFRDDGTNWNPPGTLHSQAFTSSGTFVVPNTVTVIELLLVGGGGAGINAGGGGGGGGEVIPYKSVPVTPGETLTVTIGTGGAASSGAVGANGGNSTVTGTGVSVTAYGGSSAYGGSNGWGGVYAGAQHSGAIFNVGGASETPGIAPMGCGGSAGPGNAYPQAGGSEPFHGFSGGGGAASGIPGGGSSGGAGGTATGVSAAANTGGGGGGATTIASPAIGGSGGSGYAEIRWIA